MTTVPIPHDLEVALSARAAAEGCTLEEMVTTLLKREVARELHPDWGPELERRIADISSGKVTCIPAKEAFTQIRARLDSGYWLHTQGFRLLEK